ncbi:MAG: hypothetical protein JSV78_01945 [Phycisphaerales bacterium]|nr:MAG: hypothetical protein JSV78_01945 [Phycisphaerales bacterium]
MMTKRDLMDAIMRLNPTARPEFLAEFAARELEEYLGKLESLEKYDHQLNLFECELGSGLSPA